MFFAIFQPGVEEKVGPGGAHFFNGTVTFGDIVTKLCPCTYRPEHVS